MIAARETMVPVMLSFGVFGSTLAIRICCVPAFARSPYASTVVSEPSDPSAAAWISGGTAGSAGLPVSAGSLCFAAGLFSHPADARKGRRRSRAAREGRILYTEGIILPDEHRDTL